MTAREPKRQKPTRDASDSAIKSWIQAKWKPEWWGAIDCDRCPFGRGRRWGNDEPCDQCPRWKHWIADYRRRGKK